MPKTTFDKTLKLIAQNDSLSKVPKSRLDEEVLQELIREGLVKDCEDNGYSLTRYGEIIEVLGYCSHKKQKPKLNASGKKIWKKKSNFYVILVFIAALCGCLVLI